MPKQQSYDERQRFFQPFTGQRVVVTSAHESILHQAGVEPRHIPYKIDRIGKIKTGKHSGLVFVEYGKRSSVDFSFAEILNVKKYERRK